MGEKFPLQGNDRDVLLSVILEHEKWLKTHKESEEGW